MPQRTVRIRGYTVERAGKKKDRLALRGETVEVSEEEAKEGDRLGYFEPVNTGESDSPEDTEVPDIVDMSDDELDEWLSGEYTERPPSIGTLTDAVTDAEDANRVLASEARVAAAEKRETRSGLETQLVAIAGEGFSEDGEPLAGQDDPGESDDE